MTTLFGQRGDWENISDKIVKKYDRIEEIYIRWAFINLEVTADHIDYVMFPPRNVFVRFWIYLSKKLLDLRNNFKKKIPDTGDA